MATIAFMLKVQTAVVRGHHVYKDIWVLAVAEDFTGGH